MASAFTMPDRAPLYQAPPIAYRGVRAVHAWVKASPEGIRRALPPVFEPVGDVIQLFVMHSPDAGYLGSYDEGGVVIPCRYQGVTGAHVAYEYVSSDDSLAAGREIWGYPKKLAKVGLAFEAGSVPSPRIAGAAASYDCRVLKVAACGDHDLFLGLVREWSVREGGRPVVRFGGASHRIGDALPGPAVRYPH